MEVIVYVTNVIGNILIGIFEIYSWHIFSNQKIKWKNPAIYIGLFILTVCGVVLSLFLPQYFRTILSAIILFSLNYFLFCKEISKSILMVIVTDVILLFAEFVASFLLFIIDIVVPDFNQLLYGPILISFSIPLAAFLILMTKIPTKFYNYLFKAFCNVRHTNLMIYFSATVLLISLFLIMSYMKLPSILILLCNSCLTIVYIIIIVKLANVKENYRQVYSKYETSLSSLREYEDIMDKYRIENHENKNQLLTIRNMIKAKDKSTSKYVDKLIDNKMKDNENIFAKTSKIPEGGLRATIYSKLCKMNEMQVDYILDIASNVKTVDLIQLGDDTSLNICKVIGVFLDNAIEAVENLNRKNITLEMYIMDNYLYIDVSNNYEGMIEFDKIADRGYTTKGKGHGYGLSLVEEIIRNDFKLENEKKISGDIFTQELKIKM